MSDHSGDGLFLKRDIPANSTLCFYNGIRVKPGEKDPFEDTGYQIYIDTNKGSVSSTYYHLFFIPTSFLFKKMYIFLKY